MLTNGWKVGVWHAEPRTFLDLVIGVRMLQYNHSFKSQKLDPDSGDVVSLVDDYKYDIKMDVKGPNIFEVHYIKVPENIKMLLKKIH